MHVEHGSRACNHRDVLEAACYLDRVDPLKADDIAQARLMPAAEKLLQALDLMATGIALQRVNLRRRYPEESDAEIEARLQRWLDRVDD
jgi:hypothetical protein